MNAKTAGLLAGILVLLLFLMLPAPAGLSTAGMRAAAVTLLIMVPATFACSFAFMLPSGTGTNTVIFASGRVTIPEMARCGFWLNLISVVLLTILLYLVVIPFLGITEGVPAWAG